MSKYLKITIGDSMRIINTTSIPLKWNEYLDLKFNIQLNAEQQNNSLFEPILAKSVVKQDWKVSPHPKIGVGALSAFNPIEELNVS